MAAQLWQSLRGDRTNGTRPSEPTTKDRHPKRDVRVAGRRRSMLLEDRPPRRRLRRRNPLAVAVWMTAVAASVPLIIGILLTWGDANLGNPIVDMVISVGAWLATPFRSMFIDPNPDKQLMINWSVAAAAYLVGGRILAWMLRW